MFVSCSMRTSGRERALNTAEHLVFETCFYCCVWRGLQVAYLESSIRLSSRLDQTKEDLRYSIKKRSYVIALLLRRSTRPSVWPSVCSTRYIT